MGKVKTFLPYISFFILLSSVYLVYDVIVELNPNLIPYMIRKILKIVILPIAIVVDISGLRERAWEVWKKIPVVTHIVVSFFFSLIILRLAPIAIQKIWKEDNDR